MAGRVHPSGEPSASQADLDEPLLVEDIDETLAAADAALVEPVPVSVKSPESPQLEMGELDSAGGGSGRRHRPAMRKARAKHAGPSPVPRSSAATRSPARGGVRRRTRQSVRERRRTAGGRSPQVGLDEDAVLAEPPMPTKDDLDEEDAEDAQLLQQDDAGVRAVSSAWAKWWRHHVYTILNRFYFRYWVLYVMLVFNVLIYMLLANFLATSVFLLADRERRSQDHFNELAVASVTFGVLTLAASPSIIEAFNKIRRDAFERKPHWFAHYHQHVFLGVFARSLRWVAGCGCLATGRWEWVRLPIVSVADWFSSPYSIDDCVVAGMFWASAAVGVVASIARESALYFASIAIQSSMAAGMSLVFTYSLYRLGHKFSKNNGDWLLFYWRYWTGRSEQHFYDNVVTRNRAIVATVLFTTLSCMGIYAVIVMCWLAGGWKAFFFFVYFMLLMPSIGHSMVVYVTDPAADEALGETQSQVQLHTMYPEAQTHAAAADKPTVPTQAWNIDEDDAEAGEQREASMSRTLRLKMCCYNYLHLRSARTFALFLIFFLAIALLAYPTEDQTREGRGIVLPNARVFNASVPGVADSFKYSVCFGRYGADLDVLDLALFSQLAYTPAEFFQFHFEEWFDTNTTTGWELVGQNEPSEAVTFLEFYSSTHNTSVVAIRGTASGQDAAADAVLLLDVAIAQVCPLITLLPDLVIRKIIRAISFPDWLLFPNSNIYYDPVLEYVEALQKRRSRVILTGHSLGGALAKFVGVSLSATAVTFAAPGLSWSTTKFGLSDTVLDRIATTVAAERDIVPAVGKLAGNVQTIECGLTTPECHFLSHYICELHQNCGDRVGRPVLVEQCAAWLADEVKIS